MTSSCLTSINTLLRLFFIITGSLHSLVYRFTARSRIKFLIQKWTTTTKIIKSVSTGDKSFQSVKSLLGSFYVGHIISSSSISCAVLQASVCSPCLLWWSTETLAQQRLCDRKPSSTNLPCTFWLSDLLDDLLQLLWPLLSHRALLCHGDVSFLQPREPTSAGFRLLFCSLPHLSRLYRIEES